MGGVLLNTPFNSLLTGLAEAASDPVSPRNLAMAALYPLTELKLSPKVDVRMAKKFAITEEVASLGSISKSSQ